MELLPEKRRSLYTYNGKTSVRNIHAKRDSWVVQRIFKTTEHLKEARFTENDISNMTQYNISKVYWQMRSTNKKVEWRTLVCTNFGAPK